MNESRIVGWEVRVPNVRPITTDSVLQIWSKYWNLTQSSTNCTQNAKFRTKRTKSWRNWWKIVVDSCQGFLVLYVATMKYPMRRDSQQQIAAQTVRQNFLCGHCLKLKTMKHVAEHPRIPLKRVHFVWSNTLKQNFNTNSHLILCNHEWINWNCSSNMDLPFLLFSCLIHELVERI